MMLESPLSEKTRVMIVDDHPVVRDGLRPPIMDQPDMTFAGEAGDGFEAEETALRVKPDVILMDLSLPRRNGLETMISIKQKLPDVHVLVLTVSEQGEDLLRAVRLGASGYVLKKANVDEVIDAIRSVIAGKTVLSPEMSGKLMDELQRKRLSPREEEILELLGDGLTTVDMASRLSLGEGTVSTYVRRLLYKLQLKNRAEAIAYAARRKPKKT